MKQLTLEDVVGSFDYAAKSTSDKFLQSNTSVITYAIEFYDMDGKWKLRWFEAKTKSEAEGMARKKYGEIQIVNTYISDRSLKEIMELD
ncbi:hypothetical protein BACERE00185_00256 [Bacillus mobilis]|uniref:Uncharacterized protein n=1 Tax=Bacillus mobilis TaxID=2026190 RepID=A0A1Y5YUK6_9BACI|nr:hypothetical protein [Bacillus mobilis]SMD67810.1 hypothetical protein BACERE00185_00256 [Bacillus mobilis]